MLQKSIGGGRTRSPLKSVQLARESLAQAAQTSLAQKSSAQAAQTSSNQVNMAHQRWANLENQKPSSDASQRLTSVKDRDVSLTLERMPVGSSIVGSSPSKSLPLVGGGLIGYVKSKALGNGQIISIDVLVVVMIIAVFHKKLI